MSEGIREGFYNFHKKNNKRICQFECKNIKTIQRILVLLSTCGILFYTTGLLAFPFIIGQIFMFRFFHKMMMNITLKNIESVREEVKATKSIEAVKDPLILFGISIQIFTYIFLI
jgi:hypothetical protein